MRHRISIAVAGISMLLSIVAAGLFVRSYWVSDYLEWRHGWALEPDRIRRREVCLLSHRGGLRISYGRSTQCYIPPERMRRELSYELSLNQLNRYRRITREISSPNPRYPRLSSLPDAFELRLGPFGFQYWKRPVEHFGEFGWSAGQFACVVVPYPFVAIASAVWPMWLLWRSRSRRQRTRFGLCLHCAYDLRAHAPGQKCPECGTVVPEGHRPRSLGKEEA